MTHYVLVGDLMRSRDAQNRPELAQQIENVLKNLASRFPEAWYAPPITTRGMDEVSSVIVQAERTLDMVLSVNIDLWPQRFRFVLARGEIDVRFASRDAAAMDGPAFHRAATGLERIDKAEGLLAFEVPELKPAAVALVEATIGLIGTLMTRWTQAEVGAVRAYRRHGTQAAAAEALQITQPTVSATLARANYMEILRLQQNIKGWLAEELP